MMYFAKKKKKKILGKGIFDKLLEQNGRGGGTGLREGGGDS